MIFFRRSTFIRLRWIHQTAKTNRHSPFCPQTTPQSMVPACPKDPLLYHLARIRSLPRRYCNLKGIYRRKSSNVCSERSATPRASKSTVITFHSPLSCHNYFTSTDDESTTESKIEKGLLTAKHNRRVGARNKQLSEIERMLTKLATALKVSRGEAERALRKIKVNTGALAPV